MKIPLLNNWPTLFVAFCIYAGFLSVTWFYHELPVWLVLPAGAYFLAWHGSLQHEVVHGHPTANAVFNEALVFPSLWLWLPFRIYRQEHMQHHRDERLTDPLHDPESYYIAQEAWAKKPWLNRHLFYFHNTLAGRLLTGPVLAFYHLLYRELVRLSKRNYQHLKAWCLHCLGCCLVLYWVLVICGIDLLSYVMVFVYPGIALTLLRSYAEHQAVVPLGQRTVVVEAGRLLSLLYLNNNLHVLHHAEPGTPWYHLPGRWRQRRAELLSYNDGYRFSGYSEIFVRYLLKAKEKPVFPLID